MRQRRHKQGQDKGEQLSENNKAGEATKVYAPTVWHRDHRFMIGGTLLAVGISMLVGFLGPSAATLELGPREGSLLPPWYLPAGWIEPNEWLVSILLWIAVIIGGIATVVGLRAVGDGWRPRIKRFYLFGVVLNLGALAVPPMTSADVLMYAAYGRLQTLGYDAYSMTPAELYRQQWDPILRWLERPWQDTPSVYGPVLLWLKTGAVKLGGDNMHNVVFCLALLAVSAFVIACSIVIWMARTDPGLQARAIVLTLACHPMIWAVSFGAHNEAIAIAFAIGGVALVRKTPFGAGLLVGISTCAKATSGIYGIAMGWAYRREPKKLIPFLIGAALPNCILYLGFYRKSLELASANAAYVAGSSWAHPVRRFLEPFLTGDAIGQIISILTWGGALTLGFMFSRLIPWRAAPGIAAGVAPNRDPLTVTIRASVIMTGAWLATTAYSLPWYNLLVFLPMALLGLTRLDLIMLVQTTVLNFAYVVGRVITFGKTLQITGVRIREVGSTTVGFGIIVAIVLWWHEHGLKVGSHTKAPPGGDVPADETGVTTDVDESATVSRTRSGKALTSKP